MQRLILLTLFLVSISAFHHDYVLYVFERQWAGSVCLKHSCNAPSIVNHKGEEFIVHGLWPSGKPGNEKFHMMDCEPFQYEENEIAPELLEWMDKDYVSLYNPATRFRAHEYEKHGSCYNYEASVETNKEKENIFFGKIKELTEEFPLVETFKNAGIYPSESESYEFNDIQSSLQEAFNTNERFSIGCSHVDRKQYLETVQICLDLDFKIRKCPKLRNSCSKKKPVYFPPFKRHGDGFLAQEQY